MKTAATSGAASKAKRNKGAMLGKRAAKRAAATTAAVQKASAQAEDRKRICCSTCGQAVSVLSEQGKIRAMRKASTRTTAHVTILSLINGPFIFESSYRF